MSAPLVIIGSGLAGYNLAREWRKLDSDSELLIITADEGDFYSKPMLSNALAKHKPSAELPMADASKMASDLKATILTHTRVSAIDPTRQCVQTEQGETYSYSRLVLATGATPLHAPLQGNAVDQVRVVNDLADYAAFREAIIDQQHIAIIGPGLIGCEFANDLLTAGYQVTVIGPDVQPLGRLLPEAAGEFVYRALRDAGVNWKLQTVVNEVKHANEGYRLSLSDGSEVQADAVLMAIGLTPDLQLAKLANVKTNRGIVVDRFLQTSVANIYALGDCAEVAGLWLPYVLPLMNGARALAKTLVGEETAVSYPAMPVVVKTPACPVVVAPPPSGALGEWHISADDTGVRALFKQGEVLLGMALVGEYVNDKLALSKLLPAVL